MSQGDPTTSNLRRELRAVHDRAMPLSNKDLVRRHFEEILNRKRLDACEELPAAHSHDGYEETIYGLARPETGRIAPADRRPRPNRRRRSRPAALRAPPVTDPTPEIRQKPRPQPLTFSVPEFPRSGGGVRRDR